MIKGLHHNAYRCRDSEQTRQFYEGFLGLPLVRAFEITETKTDRKTRGDRPRCERVAERPG